MSLMAFAAYCLLDRILYLDIQYRDNALYIEGQEYENDKRVIVLDRV